MKKANSCKHSFLLIIMCILCTLCSVMRAQSSIIELKNKLQSNLISDTARVNTIISLCIVYLDEVNNKTNVEKFLPELNRLSKKNQYKRGIAYSHLFDGVCNFRKKDSYVIIQIYLNALKQMEEIGDKKGMALCHQYLSQAYCYTGKYKEAIHEDQKSIEIKSLINDRIGIAISYNGIGTSYFWLGDYQKALEYYLKALKLDEELNEKFGISRMELNVACVFLNLSKPAEALKYMERSLKTKMEINDREGIALVYTNMAALYIQENKKDKAIEYCLKTVEVGKELQNPYFAFNAYVNLGNIYLEQHRIDEALDYFLKAYKDCQKTDNKINIVEVTSGIGKCYEQKKDYVSALEFYNKSLNVGKEADYKMGVKEAYSRLSTLYEKMGNLKEALSYNKLLGGLKDTLLNEQNMKQTAELNTRYETEKKEKEILLLTKDQQLKDKSLKEQRLIRIGLLIGLTLFLVLSFLLFNRYKYKQKANLILERQKEEINQKNIMITDSIDYAKTIQEAILPDDSKLKELLPEYFILYKPKAIVSGDFYWINRKDNKIIFAVADCTGHGVPGAFMSLLGHNILENVIQREEAGDPAAILTELNKEIVKRFSKGEEQNVKHAMDIAIICLDLKNYNLQYAGARNSLYIVRNEVLTEIKADKQSTGIVSKDHLEVHYTNNIYELKKDDMLYLFSDGFADQKGGQEKKKFFYQPFKTLLTSISSISVDEQHLKLDETITNWIGNGEQIDDILVIGIKIT